MTFNPPNTRIERIDNEKVMLIETRPDLSVNIEIIYHPIKQTADYQLN